MDNEINLPTDIPQRDLFLMELLIRVSSLEKLFIEKNIITPDELSDANMAEGKRLAEELQKEVQKLINSLPENK
jgi:hypothetical protein